MQTSLIRSARRANRLAAELTPQRPASRLLGYGAVFWLASAVLHSVIFLFSDTAWSGAVSWRKPIVFSLSIGLMMWAFGWVLDRLPHRPRLARALAGTFVAASSAEILIIAVQQWRGRPSHFNNATSGDTILFGLMGGLVAVMSIALLGLFIWSLIERPTNRLERLAGLAGMAMIMSGLGFGQWVLSLGGQYVDQFDRVPEVVTSGEAGVAKFPHAVAFHGIQVFMLAAAMLRRSAVPPRNAIRMLRIIVMAYLGALVFSALQSFGGRAPFDLDVVSGVLLVVSLAVLAWGMATTVRWWLTLPIGPEDAADPGRGRAGGDLSRPAVTAPARFEA